MKFKLKWRFSWEIFIFWVGDGEILDVLYFWLLKE